ncbi:MAG: hypothetical protein IPK33_16410 [Gemmatimonadetes bacterium]|nr:hypothetical protein [Gemmatimonadota bacterium]
MMALLIGAGACADFLGTGDSTPTVSQALTAAFTTVPAEFSNNTSSFGGDSDGVPSLWLPGPGGRAFGREGLMGGGLGDAFAGSMSAGVGSVITVRSAVALVAVVRATGHSAPAPDGLSVRRSRRTA